MASIKRSLARATRGARQTLRARTAVIGSTHADTLTLSRQAFTAGNVAEAALLLAPVVRDPGGQATAQALFSADREAFAREAARLASAGEPDKAEAAARVAWGLQPDLANGIALLTQLRGSGRYDEAGALLEQLQQRFPNDMGLLVHAALVNAGRGKADIASEQLWTYTQASARISTSQRRTLSRVLRDHVRQVHAAGTDTTNPHPLIEPDVALAYNAALDDNIATWRRNPFEAKLFSDAVERHFDRSTARKAAQRAPGKPRVLVVTSANWNFLTNLLEHYDAPDAALDVRTFDFALIQQVLSEENHALFAPQSLGVDADAMWRLAAEASPVFADLVAWADVVVCEWAGMHAIWLSRYLPRTSRLVVRLHSYEAFSQWPVFINWGGIDGVIFVADHIRQFATRQFGLERFKFLKTAVLPNFNHLARFARPKSERARRTLGMVGYNNWNKDPLFGAQVLKALRADDPTWRLVLVGSPWADGGKPKEAAYRAEFDAFVRDNGLADAIEYRGHTRDLPGEFTDIGFVISASWREGTHEAVLEGLASGCIPLVRRWPMTKPFGAPESVYPDLEYAETPEEAAAIARRYADPAAFDARSAQMIDYGMARFDMAAVTPGFEAFLEEAADLKIVRKGAAR